MNGRFEVRRAELLAQAQVPVEDWEGVTERLETFVEPPSEHGDCRLNCLTPTPTAWARRGITTYVRTHADGVVVKRLNRQSPCSVADRVGAANRHADR